MALRLAATVLLLLLFVIRPAVALTAARTRDERLPAIARIVFFGGFALAVLVSAWSPGIAFALLVVAGVVIVADGVMAAKGLRGTRR